MTSDQIVRNIGGQPALYLRIDEHDPTRVVVRFISDEIVMPRAEWERLPPWLEPSPFVTKGTT